MLLMMMMMGASTLDQETLKLREDFVIVKDSGHSRLLTWPDERTTAPTVLLNLRKFFLTPQFG